jgi:hypothetical protein
LAGAHGYPKAAELTGMLQLTLSHYRQRRSSGAFTPSLVSRRRQGEPATRPGLGIIALGGVVAPLPRTRPIVVSTVAALKGLVQQRGVAVTSVRAYPPRSELIMITGMLR